MTVYSVAILLEEYREGRGERGDDVFVKYLFPVPYRGLKIVN